MSRIISFGLLLAVITLLSILFFKILANFLIPLFLAALLVVIFRPLHEWITKRVGGREKIAAMLTTLGILCVVLVPFAILTALAISEGRDLLRNFKATSVAEKIDEARKSMKLDLPVASEFRQIENALDTMADARGMHDLNLHQEAWYVVQDQMRLAAKKLELSSEPRSLPRDDENADGLPIDKWQRFVDLQRAAYELEYATGELPETTAEDQEQKLEKLREYHELMDETRAGFDDAKAELAGGRIWASLKMLANPDEEQVTEYTGSFLGFLQEKLVSLGSRTGAFLFSLLFGTVIMVISLYFFLLDGPKMVESLHGLFPMDDDHERELIQEFNNVSRAVVVATLLSALVQGILAGIGFYFCGLDSIFLLTLLTCGLAMVPFFGAASVWVPCALYLYFFEGNLPAAIGLAIYGAVVVSMADNFIKPYILHGQSNLHPLVALLSVLGGVTALGPIGLLIGPMVVVFLQTLLKILQREMKNMESEDLRLAMSGPTGTIAVAAAQAATAAESGTEEADTPSKSRGKNGGGTGKKQTGAKDKSNPIEKP